MARARNIKPSFFTNEILGVLDPIIGMLFVGLWCLADKTGRLEDRPLRIKAELFPYRDQVDVNGYLTVLERSGFIDRYEVEGIGYIQVVNFDKHQSPHHTEKPKGYPPKPKNYKVLQALTVNTPLRHQLSTVGERSDSLIPDSLITDHAASVDAAPPAKKPRAPIFDAVTYLTSHGVGEKVARDWTAMRKAKKATPSETAIAGIEREASKAGLPLEVALSVCCERGWTGFKAEWVAGQQIAGAPRPRQLAI